MIQESADVSEQASVSPSAKIWHLAQVREGAVIGEAVIIGRGAYVGPGVSVGAGSKIQNGAQVYDPAIIERGVFIGPNVVLTNDRFPRAVDTDFVQRGHDGWQVVGVWVCEGASIGAGAVIVAPVTVGKWSLIAAGSVVIRDVPAFALVAGSPAKQLGWVGRAGTRLVPHEQKSDLLYCPWTGEEYELSGDGEIVLRECCD